MGGRGGGPANSLVSLYTGESAKDTYEEERKCGIEQGEDQEVVHIGREVSRGRAGGHYTQALEEPLVAGPKEEHNCPPDDDGDGGDVAARGSLRHTEEDRAED